LKRDLDLVLIDASDPFGNGHLLPWGPLREPLDQLKKADAFIITRSGNKRSSEVLTQSLERSFPGKSIFRSDHLPEKVVFPNQRREHGPEFINGKCIMAFAGIARPEAFMETLTELGAEVVFFKAFRDHHPYHPREIKELLIERRRLQAECVLTTEKDWVRIEDSIPQYSELAYLTVRFSILDGADTFFSMIKERLGKREATGNKQSRR
jgi:tetraacyldisaccharide 4'-kinase